MVMCFVFGCNNNKNRNAPHLVYSRVPKELAKECYYMIARRRQDIDRTEFLNHKYKNSFLNAQNYF